MLLLAALRTPPKLCVQSRIALVKLNRRIRGHIILDIPVDMVRPRLPSTAVRVAARRTSHDRQIRAAAATANAAAGLSAILVT